jgi:hypothetical protein
LRYQAGRCIDAPAPPAEIVDKAIERLLDKQGRTNRLPQALLERDYHALVEDCLKDINPDGSPGTPYSRYGSTNAVLLGNPIVRKLIIDLTVDRLTRLGGDRIDKLTPEELVQQGYCDPVRVFVKNEPHTRVKAEKRRWRLISSVSLVDQLVDRALNAHINKLEIAKWDKIPSKPGMGFDKESVERTIRYYNQLTRPCASDVEAYDWSTKEFILKADCEYRIRSCANANALYRRMMENRCHAYSNSVFQLGDGRLLAQLISGIMKSGLYITSSTNSHTRVLLAFIVGAQDAMAMGDDCIEDYVEDAIEKYAELGYRMKFYEPIEGCEFEFCSHIYNVETNACYALNVIKEVMRLCHRRDLKTVIDKKTALMQLDDDLCGSPLYGRVLDVLESVGWYGQ